MDTYSRKGHHRRISKVKIKSAATSGERTSSTSEEGTFIETMVLAPEGGFPATQTIDFHDSKHRGIAGQPPFCRSVRLAFLG